MKNRVLIILLIACVLTNIVWAYFFMDRVVTADYMEVELVHKQETIALLKNLILDLSDHSSKAEILKMLKIKYTNSIVHQESDSLIYIDEVGLVFKEGKLVNIMLMNE